LLARYEIQLAEVKQAKTANNIFILLVATVPPVLIYLIILWIVAGFWQQSKGNS
jgi:pilus assembly protein TadC